MGITKNANEVALRDPALLKLTGIALCLGLMVGEANAASEPCTPQKTQIELPTGSLFKRGIDVMQLLSINLISCLNASVST